jgi:hypothetical protein
MKPRIPRTLTLVAACLLLGAFSTAEARDYGRRVQRPGTSRPGFKRAVSANLTQYALRLGVYQGHGSSYQTNLAAVRHFERTNGKSRQVTRTVKRPSTSKAGAKKWNVASFTSRSPRRIGMIRSPQGHYFSLYADGRLGTPSGSTGPVWRGLPKQVKRPARTQTQVNKNK